MTHDSTKTVAITGLNGFVAAQVAVHFLERGWAVRGSVRGARRVAELEAHGTFQPWVQQGKLEVVIVDDLVKGDYSALLSGVSAVVHLAAPLPSGATSFADLLGPTVEGTINLLTQAAHVPTLEAVSIVSSASAVIDPSEALGDPAAFAKRTFGEDTYFPFTDEQLEALDPAGPLTPYLWYGGAKKNLELAAVETQKKLGATYALSLVCPPMVYGPTLTLDDASKQPAGLSESLLCGLVAGSDAELPINFSTVYADSRDLAEVFFQLVTQHKSGRWLVSNPDPIDWHRATDILRRARPQYAAAFPVGKGVGQVDQTGSPTYDASKSVRELGVKYRSLEQTVVDTIDYFAKIGKIQPSEA